MIDEYLQHFIQMFVTDYNDPTYTVIISSLDMSEECDHETLTLGLTQYNPSIYDLLKDFYIKTMGFELTEENLLSINNKASRVVDNYLENITINNRKLVLRSGLEYDNNQKMYRSVLNATLIDALPNSESRDKTVITSGDSDIFSFNTRDTVYIPLYLKTDYNEVLDNEILMITLMDHNRKNIFDKKIVLVTDKNGHVVYYPTVLPIEEDIQKYSLGEYYNDDGNTNGYHYENGIPRYLYYMRVDYLGNEQYEPFSKEFKIYIAVGSEANMNTGGS